MLRVIFLGTPIEVTSVAEKLLELKKSQAIDWPLIITPPARPAGRHQKLQPPPMSLWAKEHDISCWQVDNINEPTILNKLQQIEYDVAITAAFGQILSQAFLNLARRATINIHPSLLPKYRGATPVPATILAGDDTTGTTILFTEKKLDSGPIISQQSVPLAGHETAGYLLKKLFQLGAHMLPDALEKLKDPLFTGTTQDETKASYCGKIKKSDALLHWEHDQREIYNRFRALTPTPGVYCYLKGKRIIINDMANDTTTHLVEPANQPGYFYYDKAYKAIKVLTGDCKLLAIKQLTPEGKRTMTAQEFANALGREKKGVFTSHGT